MAQTKPTKEFIDQREGHLRGVWKDARGQWIKADKFYHQENQVWENNKRTALHTSRAPSIIDTAVDNFLSGDPRVHRPPAGRGRKHQERADRIEPWLRQILLATALLEPNPTWKQLAKNMALYGYGVLKGPMLDMEDRPEKPVKEKKESKEEFDARFTLWQSEFKTWMPFRISAPHPARVLLDPLQKTPKEAIEVTQFYSGQLHDLTLKKKAKLGGDSKVFEFNDDNPYNKINVSEYWSKEWHALVADGDLMFVEVNTWGFVPYAHAFSGWGQEETEADGPQPEKLARCLLDTLMDDLTAQSQSFSGRQHALLMATYQKFGTRQDSAEMAEKIKGDMVGDLSGPDDLWILSIPQLPAWLFEQNALVDKDLEEGSFSRALGGIRDVGVSTVGQQAILSTAAEQRFVAPSRQIEHLATITGSRILRLTDVLDEKITINEWSVGPDDIAHDYAVDIKFELQDPVLQLQQKQIGMQEVTAGLKSKETYWSADAKLEDISGEKDRLLQDLVEASPEVVNALAQRILQRDGLLELIESLQQEQQGAEALGGAGGGGGGAAEGIVGPDGQPLASTLGGGPGTQAQLRQGLTPQVPKPPNANTAVFAK